MPKLRELRDLRNALALVSWDQKVMMPPRGAPARARVLATLNTLVHDLVTDRELGDLLRELSEEPELNEPQQASVRVLTREHEKATRVPRDLVHALTEQEGHAYYAWTEARPASDFSILQPHLEKLLELKKQEADALGWEADRYDALVDIYEPAMTTEKLEAIFDELSRGLKPIVEVVLEQTADPPDFLFKSFDVTKQEELCQWLVEKLGFEKDAGRLDVSPHPFTTQVGPGDVRQTTRYQERSLLPAIYAAIHETGHALYEQGLPEEWSDLPIADVPSLALHESQSRLWENNVGRSQPFTHFLLRVLKERFPEALGSLTPEDFYRGVNRPQRTLIRVDADELTYNLHILLRFQLELALFREELDVSELPDAWDAGMEKHLGVRPKNDGEGVLQDMHWAVGIQGYFPTYTLGTLYAAAFFRKAEEQLGDLHDELARGDVKRLLDWLRENLHRYGYLYEADDIAEKVLGERVSPQPFLDYVKDKYGRLYSVSF